MHYLSSMVGGVPSQYGWLKSMQELFNQLHHGPVSNFSQYDVTFTCCEMFPVFPICIVMSMSPHAADSNKNNPIALCEYLHTDWLVSAEFKPLAFLPAESLFIATE